MTSLQLMDQVMSLPRSDRSYLAAKLIESLEQMEEVSEEEKALFNQRSHEMRTGAVRALSLQELQQEQPIGYAKI